MFDEGQFLPEVFVSPDHLWTLSVEQSAASSRLTGAVWDSSQATANLQQTHGEMEGTGYCTIIVVQSL